MKGRLKAIAAMSENRAIGFRNQIPWHLPEDFKWFKRMTTGHVILMGRKTFESIGRPLPNRETVVLSRTAEAIAGVKVIRNLNELEAIAGSREVFVCGGAEIYRQTLGLCSDLYLTRVHRTVEGDAFFPAFEADFEWVEEVERHCEFSIQHFRHRSVSGNRHV